MANEDFKDLPEYIKSNTNPNQKDYDNGLFNSYKLEPVPNYASTSAEHVISKGNAFIVIGRDRPGNRRSGYGGLGETKSSTIDIVAGRSTANVKEYDSDGVKLWSNPNPFTDASRIYISQKTDIDENFKITSGKSGLAKRSPAIALKSDHVRIIGRSSVKIVTGTERKGGPDGTLLIGTPTIELIATNRTEDLQPNVMGNNLGEYLNSINGQLQTFIGVMLDFLGKQMEFNEKIANHSHLSNFNQAPISPAGVLPSVIAEPLTVEVQKNSLYHFSNTVKNLYLLQSNIEALQLNYLNNPASEKAIKSKTVYAT